MTVDVWSKQAAQWARVGPPLRPAPADGDVLVDQANALSAAGPVRVLVLGVTPEMAQLAWPAGTQLLAVDRSEAMIGGVWPGFPAPGEGALLGDWRELTLPAASRDLVVGDGILNVLRLPSEAVQVLSAVQGILADGGRVALRTFVLPDRLESDVEVHAAAMRGQIRSFHAYKMRLLMAAQATPDAGACLGDVWDAWTLRGPSVAALAAAAGWSPGTIATIDAYRGQDTVLSFPTGAGVREIATAAGLRLHCVHTPTYELGARCPTLVLER